jgi:hypothetical protein
MAEGGETVYPSDPGEAGLRLFLQWFGGYYARSTAIEAHEASESGVHRGVVNVGRRWRLAFSLLNTLAPDADLPFEAARAAVEQRLDGARQRVALWMPRGAHLPEGEPGLSQLLLQVAGTVDTEDGRKELRRPVSLYLRRQGTSGSVVTILGGLGGHWAQFTNRVPGTYYLNALELYRLPMSEELRDELTERIVLAAGQPEADDTQVIGGGRMDGNAGGRRPGVRHRDARSRRTTTRHPALRRNCARCAGSSPDAGWRSRPMRRADCAGRGDIRRRREADVGAARGMDPTLYAGYDLLVVIADGLVKPLLKPGRAVLPWDA